jgi:two-component system, NtrC family, response regulator AtoC
VKRYLVTGHEELLMGETPRSGNGRSDNRSIAAAVPEAVSVSVSENTASGEPPSGLRSLLQNVRDEAERNAIAVVLEQTRWNRKAAARLLKVSYRTLLYKIQQYHMTPPPTYGSPSFAGQNLKGNGHGP